MNEVRKLALQKTAFRLTGDLHQTAALSGYHIPKDFCVAVIALFKATHLLDDKLHDGAVSRTLGLVQKDHELFSKQKAYAETVEQLLDFENMLTSETAGHIFVHVADEQFRRAASELAASEEEAIYMAGAIIAVSAIAAKAVHRGGIPHAA